MMNYQDLLSREWDAWEYGRLEDFSGLRRRPKSLCELHYLFEYNQLTSVLLILNQKDVDFELLVKCSTFRATQLRRESWGTDLMGVTVANPKELLKPQLPGKCVCIDDIYGHVRSQSLQSGSPLSAFETLGPLRPFFGSTTNEKWWNQWFLLNLTTRLYTHRELIPRCSHG